MKAERILDGQEAVFLPGIIHGAEHQVYILCMNWQANEGRGSFDIEIISADKIMQAYDMSKGDAEEFFGMLPDLCQGEWKYCDYPDPEFKSYVDVFFDGDFVYDIDGGVIDEMLFLVDWARERSDNT